MDIKFSSQEELYKRVKPALTSKRRELKRYDIDITEEEIWTYLVETEFKNGSNLTLSDIVSSIMHIEKEKFLKWIKYYKL